MTRAVERCADSDLGTWPDLALAATTQVSNAPRHREPPSHHSRLTFGLRVGVVVALALVAYSPLFLDVVSNAIQGSRAAYLVVVPVLAAMIADRYRNAPRGVGDAESDWITAILVGVGGFTVLWLITRRLPAISGLWQLDLLAVALWLACCTAVVFGVRYATRMAGLWLFIVCCATPLPYLLTTAYLGGTDAAAALLATALGVVAVFLSGQATVMKWRIICSLACLAVGVVGVVALSHTTLLITVAFSAGINPAAHAVALHHFSLATDRRRFPHVTAPFAPRSPMSFVVLAAVASVLFVTNVPLLHQSSALPTRADWAERAGLTAPQNFPFITRFLGPGAILQRFAAAPGAGLPSAAVDVISTPRAGALHDFSDAVWYPTDVPVNFAPIYVDGAAPVDIRAMHSNADSTASGGAHDWYAITWIWRNATVTQQVTVIVNQSKSDQRPPPEPTALSLSTTLIQPALWIGRQQAHTAGIVDDAVVQRAENVARQLLSAAAATQE